MHERIVLLIFWAVPAFISVRRLARGRCGPTLTRYRGRVKNLSAAGRFPAEHDVEAPATAVTPVRPADRCDVAGVPRGGEPVMNRRPDRPAPHRRLAGALVARDEQDEALALADRQFQSAVNRAPRAVKAHPVEVDDPVGFDASAAETPIPAPVEGRANPALRGGESDTMQRRSGGGFLLW